MVLTNSISYLHTHTRVLAQSQTSTLNTSDEMWCVCAQSFSRVWLLATLWTVAHQAPLSMGLSRQNTSGLLFPPPGDLPDRNQTCFSCISCIGRWILYHPGEAPGCGALYNHGLQIATKQSQTIIIIIINIVYIGMTMNRKKVSWVIHPTQEMMFFDTEVININDNRNPWSAVLKRKYSYGV